MSSVTVIDKHDNGSRWLVTNIFLDMRHNPTRLEEKWLRVTLANNYGA